MGNFFDAKSTSGYTFSLGSGHFSFNSKIQTVVAQSTAEAEFISAANAANQAIWLRNLLVDLGFPQLQPTIIYCDNKSAISMIKNPSFHGKTKHIKIKYFAVRYSKSQNITNFQYCESSNQLADIFTKSLTGNKHEFFRNCLGIIPKRLKEEIVG